MRSQLAASSLEAARDAPAAWTAGSPAIRGVIDVLEVDRDLAAAASTSSGAATVLPAIAIELPAGPWEPPQEARTDVLGLLVLDGLLIRRTVYGQACCAELIGPGDLLRPWLGDSDGLIAPHTEWEVVEAARLALLNGKAARLCAACPAVLAELLDRALARSRRQGVQNAIATATNGIEDRVLLLFGQLSERWGTVGGDGVVIGLPLKHAAIAALVGARRPTITTALSELRDAGTLARLADGWLLTNAGRDRLARLAEESER